MTHAEVHGVGSLLHSFVSLVNGNAEEYDVTSLGIDGRADPLARELELVDSKISTLDAPLAPKDLP